MPRERFKAIVHFKKPDELPWFEMFYDETILKWFREGLPADKLTKIEWGMCLDGALLLNWPKVLGFDPYFYFGCIDFHGGLIPIDLGPIPRFFQRMVSETERHKDLLTETGVVARRFKEERYVWYSMPMFIEFPVKDQESWEKYKSRLNPIDPRRYPKNWETDAWIEFCENYQSGPTEIVVPGFYGFGAPLMGVINFNLAFYRDPELIHEMVEYWESFILETLRECVETLRGRVDFIYWWEDMADKHGPCISPKLFKEFLLPHYKRVTGFFRKNGIEAIMVDCDGNVKPIIPLFIEAGLNGLWPLEVNCGMDPVTIRKEYGDKLFLGGGLDKRAIAKGGQAMKREVDSKVPELKKMGGYFPSIDHLVSVDISLKEFKEYAEYLRKHL